MTKNCIFVKPHDSEEKIAERFELKKILSNERTSMYQNDDMRVCIDKKVIRVLVFNNENTPLMDKIYNYFYGEQYENI